MRRRDFIALLSSSAVAWPLAARAQQPAMSVVGFLDSSSADEYAPFLAAFRAGLGQAGFVEGQNVAVEYRWANGHYDRLPALASELVRRPVAVLVATGITAARAARAATSTIRIKPPQPTGKKRHRRFILGQCSRGKALWIHGSTDSHN